MDKAKKTRPTVNRRKKQNALLAGDICILLRFRQGLLVAKFNGKGRWLSPGE